MNPDFEKMVYDRLAGKQVVSGGLPYTRQFGEMFVAALEEVYAAGLARAAEIALESNMVVGSVRLGVGIAHKIRVEKDTDHG